MTDGEKMIYAAVWADAYRWCITKYHDSELVAATSAAEIAYYAVINARRSSPVIEGSYGGKYNKMLIEIIGNGES